MAFSIREMKDTDGKIVCELSQQLGYDIDLGQFYGRMSLLKDDQNHSLWVAESMETGIVGFIHLEKTIFLVSQPRLEVIALVVGEKFRGSGVGKRLMLFAESFARGDEFDEIALTSNIKRTGAHQFYEKLGYIQKKTSHRYTKKI
jgi:GNAT superfamily N-acetyltransferase